MALALSSTLVLPSHASACAAAAGGQHLAVGSDDGSVRLYEPPEPKVQKAIRGLGSSISSILFYVPDGTDAWVAAGKSVYRFDLRTSKMILTPSEATFVKDIGQDNEDVINQLALSANRASLASTTDAGGVYVLDIASGEVSSMKTSHDSIAWSASFIPDRPSELLTGGYDCALLLHDFKLRTLLSRFDIAPAPALAPGISSLPPFITALTLSPQGVVAAGTADGRVWVGLGGIKSTSGTGKKGKRSKKWGGLNEEEGFFVKIGESLIAGLQFITPETLLSCTVHGKLALHHLTRIIASSSSLRQSQSGTSPPGGLRTTWTGQSACAKVDALAFSTQPSTNSQSDVCQVAVAGLHADKKRGAVELWMLQSLDQGVRVDVGSEVDANGSGSENGKEKDAVEVEVKAERKQKTQ